PETPCSAPPVSRGASFSALPRTSPFISQALAHDAGQDFVGTGGVINAKRQTMTVTKLKLGKVAMKVLLGAMLIDATHTTLENAESAFNGIGRNVAAHIFLVVVMHG